MSAPHTVPGGTLPVPPLATADLARALGLGEPALAARLRAFGEGAQKALPGGRRAVTRAAAGALLRERLAARGGLAALGPIACINLKGGVGKTTLTVQFAVRAAQWGLDVCVVDLDPQASATLALAGEPEDGTPVFLDVWADPATTLPGALRRIADGLTLLPSALDNTLLDGQLGHPAQQKRAVRDVCARLAALGHELILIDCPPALGTAVISTLCAARQALIPVCADAFAQKGLRLTLDEMAAIGDTFGLPQPRPRVLFNRHDRRERIHGEALAALRAQYPQALMQGVLRTSSQYARALAARRSVFADPRQSVAVVDLDAALRELLDLDREATP